MLIGIIGKPNSGKSTFFKAATMLEVEVSPRPFTTIKPNIGIAYLTIDCPEKEFGKKCNPKKGFCIGGKRFLPIKIIDIAGLVPEAYKGRGLGNRFLDEIRQANALIQVVDFSGSTDLEGKAVQNFNPEEEIKFLLKELDFWFFEKIVKFLEDRRIRNLSKSEVLKFLEEKLSGLGISKEILEKAAENFDIKSVEFASEVRRLSKPILIAANKIDLPPAQKNFDNLKGKFDNLVPVSSEAEIALKKAWKAGLIEYLPGNDFEFKKSMEEEKIRALNFIKEKIIKKYGSTGVQECLNKVVFNLLNYIVVYPVADIEKMSDKEGNFLPDAILLPKGSKCIDLAYKIHSEIGEKFVGAIDARTGKKVGRDYILKNNDIIKIFFSK